MMGPVSLSLHLLTLPVANRLDLIQTKQTNASRIAASQVSLCTHAKRNLHHQVLVQVQVVAAVHILIVLPTQIKQVVTSVLSVIGVLVDFTARMILAHRTALVHTTLECTSNTFMCVGVYNMYYIHTTNQK